MMANEISVEEITSQARVWTVHFGGKSSPTFSDAPSTNAKVLKGLPLELQLIAGVGAEIFAGYSEIKEIVRELSDPTEPRPDNADVYAKRYACYKDLYPQLRGLFVEMSS